MSIQKKKGFTLIELMVVIVIIGILAAIAIPKLFGMSAKAKASEVGPAAGTWSKLQAAYLVETSQLGSGSTIGYTPPGATQSGDTGESANFGYSITGVTNAATFVANNLSKLNDCTAGNTWQVVGTISGDDQAAVYTFNITGDNGAKTSGVLATGICGNLTPNFYKLQ